MAARDKFPSTKLGVYTPIGFLANAKIAEKLKQPIISAVQYRHEERRMQQRMRQLTEEYEAKHAGRPD